MPSEIDDFDRISASVPLLADLKPGGRFVATDLYKAGGIPLVARRLLEGGFLHTEPITVTGRSIGEHAREATETPDQQVVRPLSNPLKPTGGLVILKGNLAPEGAVVKVAGYDLRTHEGPARVFDSEELAFDAVRSGNIRAGDVVVIRYEGPSGGPGMREMLGVTAAIVGSRTGRLGRARHRRTVFRRDTRIDGRTCRPGSGARRTDCRPARRRYGAHRSDGTSFERGAQRRGHRQPHRRTAGARRASDDRRDGQICATRFIGGAGSGNETDRGSAIGVRRSDTEARWRSARRSGVGARRSALGAIRKDNSL